MDEAIEESGGPWLLGEDITLADVAVMPAIVRMADLGQETAWQDLPRVHAGTTPFACIRHFDQRIIRARCSRSDFRICALERESSRLPAVRQGSELQSGRRHIVPNPPGSLTVFVRMHLLRDFAPNQATFGQPGAGALGSALDQRAREGEIGWRSDQRTERRRNEVLDSRVEFHAIHAATGAAINSVSACSAQATAPRGGASKAQA